MPQSKSEVTLTSIENWDEWQDYVSSKIAEDIWKAINPVERTEILVDEPRRPSFRDVNPAANSEVDLNEKQIRQYRIIYDNWKEDHAVFKQQKADLVKAKDIVFGSVDEKMARYLDRRDSLINWIDSLHGAVKAEKSKVIETLSTEYQDIMKSFNCSNSKVFLDWVWKWENFLLKASRQQMLEQLSPVKILPR